MDALDRRSLLRVGAGLLVAGYGWELAGRAQAAVDPRLKKLQAAIKGPVYTRASLEYAQARLEYQQRFDSVYPLAVVQPLSAADVGQIVNWSRKAKVPLAIRSGGHSYAGYSTGTGVVVDLGRLAGISFDKATSVVTIGAGARLIDVESTLSASGRAIPNGSCPTVGIGGLALGGGVGFASRRFGTLSDNVVSLSVVTADGKAKTASAVKNPDLFWACRGGGGGNFGVVTSFGVTTRPAAGVSTFLVTWPWSSAAAAIGAWQSFAPQAPDELFAPLYLRSGTTEPAIQSFGQFFGLQAELVSLIKPLTAVAGATARFASSSYLDAQMRWAGCTGKTVDQCHLVGETPGGTLGRGNFVAKSDYFNAPLTTAALDAIAQWLARPEPASFGFGSLELDPYGGAINRVEPAETAFVHRNAVASAQYLAHWSQPSGQAGALSWLRGFHAAMRPHASGFAYQNYMDPELTTWKHAYYGANYKRLQKVKAAVDPGWLFKFAQGITPG
jgi:FAD binding domain/Berberine and berberine like